MTDMQVATNEPLKRLSAEPGLYCYEAANGHARRPAFAGDVQERDLPKSTSSRWKTYVNASYSYVRSYVRRDKAFYAIITAYGLAVTLTALWIGDIGWIRPFCYVGVFANGVLVCGSLVIAHLIKRGRGLSPEIFSGIILFVAVTIFLGFFTSMKSMMPSIAPFKFDTFLADIDSAIYGKDAWRRLTWMNPYTSIIRSDYAFFWAGILSFMTLCICCSRTQIRTQYLLTLFGCWILVGTIIPLLLMAGGPVFYAGLTGSDRFAPLVEHLNRTPGPGSEIPQGLWDGYVNRLPGYGHGISAFPSLHVSMATLFTLAGLRINRYLGCALMAFLVFIMLASVHLGWHYAIDGYAAIALTVMLWKGAGRLASKVSCPERVEVHRDGSWRGA